MFMDGTTIVGKGLLTDIYTTCKCSLSSSNKDMIEAGIREDHVDEIMAKFNTLGDDLGFVNDIYYLNETELGISTVINYRNSCGGTAQNSTPLPVCTTRLFNHRHAEIVASYMSDGSTSSVALKFIKIRKEMELANMTWVHESLVHILGMPIAAHVTPESIPGSVSTLYWWTTVNLQTISPAYLSAGIETMWAMILRVAFQRTLSFEQKTCIQNIPDPTSMVLKMSDFGYIFGLIFVCGELLVNIMCLIACIPRFIEVHPISPAIKINRDYTYFLLLLNGSFTAGILSECKSSVHIDDVWVKMDLNVRIGETIGTRDDPEKGNVTVDRPKFVTNLVRGKRYV
jgi:hypothetical protein